MKTLTFIGVFIAVLGVAAISGAPQGALSAKAAGDRYVVTPIDGGIMRVDRRTGEVSVCQKIQDRWACELVSDDRRYLEREIDQLERDNARLRNRGHKRSGLKQQDRANKKREEARRREQQINDMEEPGGFMSPAEVDNAMNTFERMMDRFMDTAKQIKRRMSEGEKP